MTRLRDRPWMFLWPWLIGTVGLTLLPALGAVVMSGFEFRGAGAPARWVGWQHYRDAVGMDRSASSQDRRADAPPAAAVAERSRRFVVSMKNSLWFALWAVPLELGVALFVALALHRRFVGARVVRALAYLPHVLGGAATLMIWGWLLNPRFGWINQAIRAGYAAVDPLVRVFSANGTTGWGVPDWLYSSTWCMPALVLIRVWSFGATMLIFLAALRRVDPSLHEAARLDGAGRWHRLVNVTVPQIAPVILFNAVVLTVFSLQAFTEPFLLSQRSQRDGLLLFVPYLYETAFGMTPRLGYASAVSVIFVGVTLLAVLPLVLAARHWTRGSTEGGYAP